MSDNLFRKALLTGFGFIDLTAEKAENLVKELVKRGEIVEGESKKYVDELMSKAKETEENLKGKVDEILKDKQYATKESVDELSKYLGVCGRVPLLDPCRGVCKRISGSERISPKTSTKSFCCSESNISFI